MEVVNQVLQQNNIDESKNLDTFQEESTNCLALTVREEYKITVVKNIIGKSAKVSWKIALSLLVMNFLNTFL